MHSPCDAEEPVSGHDHLRVGNMDLTSQKSLCFESFGIPSYSVRPLDLHNSSSVNLVHLNFFPTAIFLAAFLLVLAHSLLIVDLSKYILKSSVGVRLSTEVDRGGCTPGFLLRRKGWGNLGKWPGCFSVFHPPE